MCNVREVVVVVLVVVVSFPEAVADCSSGCSHCGAASRGSGGCSSGCSHCGVTSGGSGGCS